jgi:hypothetical protein
MRYTCQGRRNRQVLEDALRNAAWSFAAVQRNLLAAAEDVRSARLEVLFRANAALAQARREIA